MMLHRCFFGISTCAALALAPVANGADLSADWSGTINPNGVWEYGEYAGGPAFYQINLNPLLLAPTVEAWDQGFVNSSFVSKETSGAGASLGSTVWIGGNVVLRPGINAQSAVARFVAPVAGTYTYSVTFSPADIAGGTRDVNVYINGALVSTSPLNGPAPGPVVTFSNGIGVVLAVGDTIDYVVGVGGTPADWDLDAAALRNAVVNLLPAGPVVNKPCRVRQPWTKPWASHISVVRDCLGNEVSWGPVAMDDFICDKDTKFNRLTWWGTNPTQNGVPQKLFYIRIWQDNQQCFPAVPVYQVCVQPKIKLVSVDCQQRRVFRFATLLPPPFLALAGQRYWLQISEVDDDPNAAGVISSPNPGAPDFAWSSHRKIKNCRALQRNTLSGFFQQPLIDPCDNTPEDLAFTLSSRFVGGVITPVPFSPTVFTVKFFDTNGNIMDECPVLPDATGAFVCETDLPDGCYEVQIYGMATVGGRSSTPVCLIDGSPTNLGTIALPTGDANNSLQVTFGDITRVLGEWLKKFDVF